MLGHLQHLVFAFVVVVVLKGDAFLFFNMLALNVRKTGF